MFCQRSYCHFPYRSYRLYHEKKETQHTSELELHGRTTYEVTHRTNEFTIVEFIIQKVALILAIEINDTLANAPYVKSQVDPALQSQV